MTEALRLLAERVEKASGPDRELDVAIVYGLYPNIGNYEGQCIDDDPIFWHEPYRKKPCPKFTASLDAAMSLVPEGRGWCIDTREQCCAQVDGPDALWWDAATPALALCAAALHARASQEQRNEP